MLHMALVFLVIGLIAALLGFTTIAGASIAIAKFLAGLFLMLFLVFLILGMPPADASSLTPAGSCAAVKRLIQWRISELRDPPLNARLHSLSPRRCHAAFLIVWRRRASQPGRSRTAALAAVEGRPARAADRDGRRSGVRRARRSRRAFQLTVREESLGAITVSYKGKTIVLTPDQALASVGGPAHLAAGGAVAQRAPLARAGGVHQPRAGARSTTHASTCASRRTCWSSATCACRASRSATKRSAPRGG